MVISHKCIKANHTNPVYGVFFLRVLVFKSNSFPSEKVNICFPQIIFQSDKEKYIKIALQCFKNSLIIRVNLPLNKLHDKVFFSSISSPEKNILVKPLVRG